MTGPEHYREAEFLLTSHAETLGRIDASDPSAGECLSLAASLMAVAQVHATLALAAATAETIGSRGPGDLDLDWLPILQGATS